ncbi:MAG: hypothetical protein EBU90_12050 [Proteobacteria bacterium]|nr:hypothetical protein [Pseudomonadota bacterium]NBP14819.1 hypothetical protein [bacterium]
MDFFYDGQVRRYLTQFMNILSNFAYKDGKGNLVQVPVRYGDMTRQVAQIIKKNSENTIPSAPFIACYIKDLQFDRARLQDPTFISKVHIRERAFDEDNQEYLNVQGSNFTVERIMPSPWTITFSADIWSTNTEMKLQIWEQIVVFFNPSFEIQTTDNYIDWTSLSTVTLERQTYSSRTIPQGLNEDIDILTMEFTAPIWITPPAKVKKLGIVTKIISNAYAVTQGLINSTYDKETAAEIFGDINPDTVITVTPGNYDLLVLNNTARLVHSNGQGDDINVTEPGNSFSWYRLLDLYPGKFRAGLSQLRFAQPDGNEVVATISINPVDDNIMNLNIDPDTIPNNTIIQGRGTVDAVINPETFNPIPHPAVGTRYIILEDINVNPLYGTFGYDGPVAWKNLDGSDFRAHANDIIEWNGQLWYSIFNSQTETDVVYITNSYTGTQYKWVNNSWTKTYEGVYDKQLWRMIL